MPKRTILLMVLFLLSINMFVFSFSIRSVSASSPVYIRADGSIDPPTAPIQRTGDVYTLTGNITSDTEGIVVERDNIVVDGSGFTAEGAGADYARALIFRLRVHHLIVTML